MNQASRNKGSLDFLQSQINRMHAKKQQKTDEVSNKTKSVNQHQDKIIQFLKENIKSNRQPKLENLNKKLQLLKNNLSSAKNDLPAIKSTNLAKAVLRNKNHHSIEYIKKYIYKIKKRLIKTLKHLLLMMPIL